MIKLHHTVRRFFFNNVIVPPVKDQFVYGIQRLPMFDPLFALFINRGQFSRKSAMLAGGGMEFDRRLKDIVTDGNPPLTISRLDFLPG